jgi:hypothetical protein
MKRRGAVETDAEIVETRGSGRLSISALLEAAGQEDLPPAQILGAVTGTLIGLAKSGTPLVDFPGNRLGRAIIARTTVELRDTDVGGEVALMFENGDPQLPILIGAIRAPETPANVSRRTVTASVDGERVVVTAQDELVLRCGEASITLTRAGKVLIRGKYLLSRSSGMNRIKGASVELN